MPNINEYIVPLLSGMLGGTLFMALILLWYLKSGRLGLYIDNIFARARAKAQAKYYPESIHKILGVYDHIPEKELQTACDGLNYNYKEIELSTITHNIGKDDQYTCVLLVGKQIR